MNVTVENLAPCRKLVRIEIEPAEVDSAFAEVTSQYQKQVRLPGFRPGKAPRELVTRTYSKDIEEETRRKLVSDNYKKALEDQKLEVVGTPDFEEIEFGRGKRMQFAVTVETAPEFELPEYKGIPVKKELRSVTDEDLTKALDALREQRATYIDVARPVQMGDFVVVNYTGTSDGKPLIEIAPTARGLTQQQGFWLHVEPGSFIPGFTEQLIGANAGEKRTVKVDFPPDFVSPQLVGHKGVYEVEIVQVKEKSFPPIDDEFAKSFGAENAEGLRAGVQRDLQNELDYKLRRAVRDQLIRSVMARVNFELPESVVENETRNVVYDIVRENQRRGIGREIIEKQKDEIYNVAANNAKERVKIAFLLERIAQKEQIAVSQEEITQRILHLSQQYQIRPEKLVKQLRERNGLAEIHEQILNAKTLEFLEKNARIEEVPAAPPE